MAYDEPTATRIRAILAKRPELSIEKKMFGVLCFMIDGHMCCGLYANTLMVRVGVDAYPDALDLPHARPMTFTGRPLAGFVYVDPPGIKTSATLTRWLARSIDYVATLPAKKPAKRKPRPRLVAQRPRFAR